jgi:hypothetical protein
MKWEEVVVPLVDEMLGCVISQACLLEKRKHYQQGVEKNFAPCRQFFIL